MDETEGALTRRARRSAKAVPALVLAAAAAMTWLAILRLDVLAPKLPGVWDAAQLLPVGQDLIYGVDAARRADDPAADDRERQLREALRELVAPGASDVATASWRQDGDDLVAVAVVETADPEATAASLERSGVRAWAEGDSYVVAIGVAASPPEDTAVVFDRASERVRTSVQLARVWWFVALAVIPAAALWLALVTARTLVALLQVIVLLAWLMVRLVFFLLVQLPLAIVTRGRLGTRRPPRIQRSEPRVPPSIASNVRCIDVDETELSTRTKSLAAAGLALLFMAIALPALTPTWWPGSLVWAAAAGAWLGLGTLRRRWPFLRAMQWLLIGMAAFAIAEAVAGLGPGSPTGNPLVAGAVVAVAVVVLLLSLRDALSSSAGPSYVSSFSDLGPRSLAYLIGALGLAFAATCLFLGSNGDPDLGSHLTSKAMAGLGLLAVPVAVRHFRAAQAAARRDEAREHGVGEVLLLRSFVDDGLKVRSRMRDRTGLERFIPLSREPFEDVVVRAFEARGPVVAIAKPGTEEGEFGAARDRIVVEDWLTAVKAEMAESVYVLAVLGPTEGLHVELQTLSSLDLLSRVCLLVPPVAPADAAARIASGTAATNGPEGWGSLDADRIDDRQVLAFAGVGDNRLLFLCRDRDSVGAYLRLGEWLAHPP